MTNSSRARDKRQGREPRWTPPKTSDLRPRYVYASSYLDDFVHGHTYFDMVTELIQNEFDAGGTYVEMDFAINHMQVTGNGRTIDHNGWKRLSVMFGTGLAADSDGSINDIPPKDGLIGSKNFGLNSLFLVGDRIDVASGGQHSFKDRFLGAPERPERDSQTKDRPGVVIHVEFRDSVDEDYDPFTLERERRLLDGLVNHFEYCAVKLIQPDSKAGIGQIEVISERLDRRIVWKQEAALVKRLSGRKTAIERTVYVQDGTVASLPNPKVLLKEMEFQESIPIPASVRIPAAFKDGEVPKYFRPRKGRVRIGISVRLNRGHLDVDHQGMFYYPLGLRAGRTGTAVSINAPFYLDSDRSRLRENSEWNDWLLEQAAELTIDCLVHDWLERFGSRSFLALREVATSSSSRYFERISELLENEPCWPTRGRGKNGHPVLRPAAYIVIPTRKELDRFLSPGRYLDDSIDSGRFGEDIKKLALASGAKPFGINSLVHLRCKGEDSDALETELNGEAGYTYTKFGERLRDEKLQFQFAEALESVRLRLTSKHKNDLRSSPSTLAADSDLKPAEDLYAVDPVIGDACPVSVSERLHPSFWNSDAKIFRDNRNGLCKPFEENAWALDVSAEIESGTATPEQRDGLYRYILYKDGKFRPATIRALRNLPVLKDHRDKWAKPSDIASRQIRGSDSLEPVLSFPNEDYATKTELRSRFKFRQRLQGADLVRMAKHVSSNPDQAEAFEISLQRHEGILKKKDWKQLSEIPFLRWSTEDSESFEAPERLYLRNQVTEAALGDQARFPSGSRIKLYRSLGCMEFPAVQDIISYLAELKQMDAEVPKPEIVYPVLVKALKLKGISTKVYAADPIVGTDKGYQPPDDIFTVTRSPKLLQQAVPQIPQRKAMVDAVSALGAYERPSDHHWAMGFRWIGQKYRRATGPVTPADRTTLGEAYRRRGAVGLPEEVEANVKCLLGRNGMLYSRGDAQAGRFVLNDYPELADAIEAQGVSIGFTDDDRGSQPFFDSLGLTKLTEIMRQPKPVVGLKANPPRRFDPVKTLERLHTKDLASALVAICRHHALSDKTFTQPQLRIIERKLADIDDITVVESLGLVYQIKGKSVKVDAEVWLEANQLSLMRFKNKTEFNQLLAIGLARILSISASDHGKLWNTINGLLTCETSKQMATYLWRSHISWEPESSDVRDDSEDDDSDDWSLPNDDDPNAALNDALAKRGNERASAPQGEVPSVPVSSGAGQSSQDPSSSGRTALPQPLPPIEQVSLEPAPVSGGWSPPKRNPSATGGGSGGGGGWTPRTPLEIQRDDEIGLRGERLVFDKERERVKALGGDENRVVWTAEHNRGADHDIKSVDPNGEDLWIEVKSTSGRDGWFFWSIAEYDKAAQEGDRYVLWRVYEANSTNPKYKKFPNPVALHRNKELRIEFANFRAEVEPLTA